MTFKKIVLQLHLWLGLVSGIIVFIVCITGAIWCFNEEITSLLEPELWVSQENQPVLQPSRMDSIAQNEFEGEHARYLMYRNGKATQVGTYGDGYSVAVAVNPYSGEVLKKIDYYGQSGNFDFFNFILQGHRFLWLPWKTGRPIVNYATLVFVMILISGLILWWPKTRKATRARTWFRWKKGTGAQRKWFDLHTVLGFYAFVVLLAITLTGMVWGIEWYSKSLYWVTSGGQSLPSWQTAQSDTLQVNQITSGQAVDKVFRRIVSENPNAEGFYINFPSEDDPASAISITVCPNAGKYYNRDSYSFDRYTLQEIPMNGPDDGKYEDAGFADKLRRMNYDIHTGAIGGLPGKTMVFFAALIGASLPVTGVYMYFRKRRKNKKR